MAEYPSAIKTFTNPTSTDNLNSATVPHATQHSQVNDEITAIETELGVNPKGSYSSVAERINAALGTVTTVSVVSANGLAGTVATAGTTPAITLTTSITGVLKGNGTAISAAAAGTDYVAPNAGITGDTKTKVTYDAKGLVTAGADATTADIADSSNKRYVTDAQLTVIGNTSGTNTGDQTSVTGNAGTATALQTARNINGVSFDGTANITVTAAGSTLSDTVTVAKGGTGAVTLTGVLVGNGTSAFTAVTAPSGTIVGTTDTQTLTNKSVTKRVVTTTDDATAVIDVGVTDTYQLSAIANATTFTLTGSPTDAQQINIRLKDAGVAKALTWTGFTPIGVTLPTTTVASKWTYVGVIYNSAASQYHVVSVVTEA